MTVNGHIRSANGPDGLSGGGAPAAYKGFEDGSAVPTCGSTWTSKPGNSSNPPAALPPYMAVVVTDKVVKSGSTVTGTVRRIVVVYTVGSGYGPNPGQEGIGRVVAVVCSS